MAARVSIRRFSAKPCNGLQPLDKPGDCHIAHPQDTLAAVPVALLLCLLSVVVKLLRRLGCLRTQGHVQESALVCILQGEYMALNSAEEGLSGLCDASLRYSRLSGHSR
jgi:hypothetical protein